MNILQRMLVRKDLESYLENHRADLEPWVAKVLPFLRPSLRAWVVEHGHEASGIVCDCVLKVFDQNQ